MTRIRAFHLKMGRWSSDQLESDRIVLETEQLNSWDEFCEKQNEIRDHLYKSFDIPNGSTLFFTIGEAIRLFGSMGLSTRHTPLRRVLIVSEDAWDDSSTSGLVEVLVGLLNTNEWRTHSRSPDVRCNEEQYNVERRISPRKIV